MLLIFTSREASVLIIILVVMAETTAGTDRQTLDILAKTALLTVTLVKVRQPVSSASLTVRTTLAAEEVEDTTPITVRAIKKEVLVVHLVV